MKKFKLIGLIAMVIIVVGVSIGLTVYFTKRVAVSDFSLVITVSQDTFYEGENIEVKIVFRNNSGRRLNVTFADGCFFRTFTPTQYNLGDCTMMVTQDTFKRNEERVVRKNLGSSLAMGNHDLSASVVFSFRNRGMHVNSNVIVLTVI